MTKCCQRCNRIDALLASSQSAFGNWPAVSVTVDGAVIRRRDAVSGEWQYGWRVRDADADPGLAAALGGGSCGPSGPA